MSEQARALCVVKVFVPETPDSIAVLLALIDGLGHGSHVPNSKLLVVAPCSQGGSEWPLRVYHSLATCQ